MTTARRTAACILLAFTLGGTLAQDYGDYEGGWEGGDAGGGGGQEYGDSYQDYAGEYAEQDDLYHNYAMRQQDKKMAGGGGARGGPGLIKLAACSAAGWFVGAKFHTRRATRTLRAKHKSEHKALYTQYYDDVYKLQQSNSELADAVEKLQRAVVQVGEEREMEAIKRDYDEFKQPDIDGDDRISRAEFNMYLKTYLANYPGLEEKDYPKYEDFDHDGDGYISFQEYAQQMALQVQQAEKNSAAGAGGGGGKR